MTTDFARGWSCDCNTNPQALRSGENALFSVFRYGLIYTGPYPASTSLRALPRVSPTPRGSLSTCGSWMSRMRIHTGTAFGLDTHPRTQRIRVQHEYRGILQRFPVPETRPLDSRRNKHLVLPEAAIPYKAR
jgi:hypothetical protein